MAALNAAKLAGRWFDMKKRKFAEGGNIALEELASGRDKGSFDEDVYARAKRFLERGGKEEAVRPPVVRARKSPASTGRPMGGDMPVPMPVPMPVSRSSAAGEIPSESPYAAPASTGEEAYSDTGRNLMNILSATGVGGSGALLGAGLRAAGYPSRMAAREAAEVAAAAKRGAASRADIQAKRAATKRKSGIAKAMEEAKPILQARPGKAPVRSKSRYDQDEAGVEFKRGGKTKSFAKGGSVRGGGCEVRGKTKGSMR